MLRFSPYDFIMKTFEKTRTHDLAWCTLGQYFHCKPCVPPELADFPPKGKTFFPNSSFCAKYKTAHLLLLICAPPDAFSEVSPTTYCDLSLRIQSDAGRWATEIANSCFDVDTAVQLIRLYNMIDHEASDINPLIQDFLHS